MNFGKQRQQHVIAATGPDLKARWLRVLLLAVAATAVVLLFSPMTSPRAAEPFAPTIKFELSTTDAAANPDARITVDNSNSTDDIKDLELNLPDGFWGSLDAAEKCSWDDAEDGNCASDTIIGKVSNDARIDNSDVHLAGNIYLTDAAPGNDDPAGLTVVVPAKVGGVDLGKVIVHARVQARYAPIAPILVPPIPRIVPNGPNAKGSILGIKTTVTEIPNSIGPSSPGATTDGRTLSFHIKRLVIDLRSNQDVGAGYSPLLTNPSRCGDIALTGTSTSYGNIDADLVSNTLSISDCDAPPIGATTFSMNLIGAGATPTAGELVGLETTMEFPPKAATLNSIEVRLPSMVATNLPSFGESADQCGTTAAPSPWSSFDPTACPEQAKIGTIEITTPLMDVPLHGNVYAIAKSPIPWLGVDISPSNDPADPQYTNPKGINIRLVGVTKTDKVNPACDGAFDPCLQQIVATFGQLKNTPPSPFPYDSDPIPLPDAPIRAVKLIVNGPDRAGVNGPLSGKVLKVAQANDSACQPVDDFTATLSSHAKSGLNDRLSYAIDSAEFSGCDVRDVTFDTGPASVLGKKTSALTPSFDFTSVSTPPLLCGVDDFANDYEPCTSPFTDKDTLTPGIHLLTVGGSPLERRSFVVEPEAPAVSPPPTTAITAGPADGSVTADVTPTWNFTASESSDLQCSLDDGAFLPCDPGAGPSASGSFSVIDADAVQFFPGSSHKFAVRARDAAGNVGAPAEASFTIAVPFGPTFNAALSTTFARAHPSVDITITNPSEQNIENATVNMPDGFFGGLQGVASICPVAAANAGACPASSKVGTVDTEAIVDQSIVRISGEVFLTDPYVAGDAAGLSIKVPAVIQEIDLGDVVVPVRASVRGQAHGMDALVIGVPQSIDPAKSGNTFDDITFFNMRKVVMHLDTGAGAAKPLFTNPSSCAVGPFVASYQSYSAATSSTSQQVNFIGCETLGFAPHLTASIVKPDGTAPDKSPYQDVNLSASLTANPDQAGIARASILMPKPLTINVVKLPARICEQNEYVLNACPPETIIGHATATSPLLLPGEILSGPVYILRGENTVLPRLFVRLGGRIFVNVVGKTSFENKTQIRTIFDDLPDAPLSSFNISVTNLLSTMKEPCQDAREFGGAMTGTLYGHNGKTADVNAPFVFNCSGNYYKFKFNERGKKSGLKIWTKSTGDNGTYKKLKLRFSKHLTMTTRRALIHRLAVRVNGKRMSHKCRRYKSGAAFRYRSKSLLEIKFCGRKNVREVGIAFRSKALIAGKRLRRPVVKVTVTDRRNSRSNDRLHLHDKAFRKNFFLP